ncbi:hypothetical protein C9374_007646 [Naegleria lovaniensis]|uniref:Uncharacterized protein n=1 Tax=Naegleria lovaniensis TaxID=51637 RepID=A0AA88GI40_NAELO|nr:uncharacterized protein C9374_007646 [Naegleria lovaniensis]KAG2379008.1 hypothetical protein C9374_007646 [Naegleria lovaniensis]
MGNAIAYSSEVLSSPDSGWKISSSWHHEINDFQTPRVSMACCWKASEPSTKHDDKTHRYLDFHGKTIPCEILHMIASYLSMRHIQRFIAPISKATYYDFFLNPLSMHWRMLNFSDDWTLTDHQLLFYLNTNLLTNTETLILRRTCITSLSLRPLAKALHDHHLPQIRMVDIRGCFMASYQLRMEMKLTRPEVVEMDSTPKSQILRSSDSMVGDLNFILNTAGLRSLDAEHQLHRGFDCRNCFCSFCCEYNSKMKFLLTATGSSCVDCAAFTFNFTFLDCYDLPDDQIDPRNCQVLCCTSADFVFSQHHLRYILCKVRRYRNLRDTNNSSLSQLVFRKSVEITMAGKHFTQLECVMDGKGPVLIFCNKDNDGIVVVESCFGMVLMSFDRYIERRDCIKACRFMAVNLSLDFADLVLSSSPLSHFTCRKDQ